MWEDPIFNNFQNSAHCFPRILVYSSKTMTSQKGNIIELCLEKSGRDSILLDPFL